MTGSEYQKVAKESDLVEGVPQLVKVGDADVLVVRLEGAVHAMANKCSHYECPLNEGAVFGHHVVCRCHDARFDLTTGRALAAPALKDLPTYPVRLEAGEVWLGPAQKPRAPKPEGTDGRTFLIVGGGAAGNAAAETLRREGFAGKVIMVSSDEDQPYDRPNLSKEFLSGEAKPEWMPLRSPKFYEQQNIEVRLGTRVSAVDPRAKTVTLASGETLAFDKMLLATGGAPRPLPIPGADGKGCYTLRSFADARAIAQAAEGMKTAILIGAGFIGMELASALRTRGLGVEVVAPEALPFAQVVGERVALFLKKRHEDKGVVFHLGVTTKSIAGDAGNKTVSLSDGSTLKADLVIFGLGVKPVVDYLAGTDLVQNGAVPVDARLETKYPGILAAGDIAVVPYRPAGEGVRIEHWVVAERQGQHAARAMLGSNAGYEEIPFFWTRQTGISLKYIGFARQWDQTAVRGNVEAGKFVVGYFQKGKLAAAASVGMPNDLTAIEVMLKRNIALSPEQLADSGVDLLAIAKG
jgi:apoptosis-inducing factor 3